MALNLSKSYTPSSGQIANAASYNTDIAALFNAFSGLEAQTSTLGGLTITPSANSTTIFRVNNAAGTELFSLDTSNSYMKLKATGRFYLDGGGNTYILESAADVISFYTGGNLGPVIDQAGNFGVQATDKIYLDGLADTYIYESAANTINFATGGTTGQMQITGDGSIYFGALSTITGQSDVQYNLGTGELGYVSSSLRYKENVRDYESVLNKVMALRPVRFTFKESGDEGFGLIAEEAYPLFPEIVPLKNGQPETVTYSQLSTIAIKAIQELTARIEVLEAK